MIGCNLKWPSDKANHTCENIFEHGHMNRYELLIGTGLLCLFLYLLCYAAVLKFLTYYTYSILCSCCLKFDCSIRVYSLVSKNYLIL